MTIVDGFAYTYCHVMALKLHNYIILICKLCTNKNYTSKPNSNFIHIYLIVHCILPVALLISLITTTTIHIFDILDYNPVFHPLIPLVPLVSY